MSVSKKIASVLPTVAVLRDSSASILGLVVGEDPTLVDLFYSFIY